MCRSDQRSAQFVGMLDTVVTEGSRIVIFADTAMGAIRVNKVSKNSYVLLGMAIESISSNS